MNANQACQALNVESNASFEDIKYAYRKLALELHPDKNTREVDGQKFKQVTEAYHFLKKDHKRFVSKDWSSTSEKDYTNSSNKQKHNFGKRKPQWGAPPGGRTPEEDWSRFTKEFEESNPNFWKEYEKEFWKNYDLGGHNTKENSNNSEKKRQEPKINFSVDVDPSLCIGCCSCETIAPEVFVVDKITKLNPKSRAYNQRGAGYNKVMNAAETCPTKAINVNDKDSGKRLYPW